MKDINSLMASKFTIYIMEYFTSSNTITCHQNSLPIVCIRIYTLNFWRTNIKWINTVIDTINSVFITCFNLAQIPHSSSFPMLWYFANPIYTTILHRHIRVKTLGYSIIDDHLLTFVQ